MGLYVFDEPRTAIDKQHNKDTQSIAEANKAEKGQPAKQARDLYRIWKNQLILKEKGKQCFVEYFKKLANKKKTSNHDNWISALNYLNNFTNGSLKFFDLDESFCEDFKNYLLTAPG